MKPLSPVHLKRTAEFNFTTYSIGVGKDDKLHADCKIEDLFRPQWWQHHSKRLRHGDIVRVRAVDGSFDVYVNVVNVVSGGVVVEPWPKIPGETSTLEKIANDARSVYKPQMKAGKPVPRVEHNPATNWRIIGIDGEEHSRGYPTESEAAKAMMRMMQDLGIKSVEGVDAPKETAKPPKTKTKTTRKAA